MRVAGIDLGSNTFLLLIAEIENASIVKVIHDEAKVVRLGQGVNATKSFHPEAISRADRCLESFNESIKEYDVDKVVAVATSAARDVKNKHELLELGEKYNIPISIISGDLEAELTYKGSIPNAGANKGVAVLDIGGGSTEIIGQSESGEVTGISIDVGSVRLSEMFISAHPVEPAEIDKMRGYIKGQVDAAKERIPQIHELVAVAGTPTTMASVILGQDFDVDTVHEQKIDVSIMESWLTKLSRMSVEQREQLKGMQRGRADVIVAGLSILIEFCRALAVEQVIVSCRGVRYGVAANWEKVR